MTTPQPAALPELLREIVAYCREFGHDWSNLAEAEHMLAALQSQPAAAGVSDAEILTEAARHLGEMHVENCRLDDIKAFARAILALRPQAVPMTDEVKVAEALRRIKALNSREYGDSAFYLSYVAEMLETCPDCQGNGYGDDFQECPTCNGSGKRHGITAQGGEG